MKAIKVLSLVILSLLSLYVVSTQPVRSQESTIIYILSDGSVDPSTAPIQRVGDAYTFTDNLMDHSLVVQCNDIIIDGAGFTIAGEEEAVIDLSYISNVTIRNVQIKGALYYGIKVAESLRVTITGNTITDSSSGIFSYNTTQSTISGNTIENNDVGVDIRSSSYIVFGNNTITSNQNGALLSEFSDSQVSENSITRNYIGIQLRNSSNSNSITSNAIIDNSEGILFFNSTLNNVVYNNVTNNDVGIGFNSASRNMIRSNYFVSNSKQVYDSSMDDPSVTNSTNYWYFAYPTGGNYWSDYTGVDVKSGDDQDQDGSDGIGDTPYIIYGYNIDEYPLMPYGSPPAISIVSPQNTTYTVNSVSLTFTVNEPTSWTAYSLDGQANEEIAGNKTLKELVVGSHHITVYARDEDGFENSATVYFTIAEGAEPPKSEPFPITWVVVIIVIAVVGAALLVYFRKKKHYSKVNMQQGRVQLDADWNE